MASSWTHAVVAVAIAAPLVPITTRPRVWAAIAIAAILPDVDAIGRPFSHGDLEFLGGHRALTHSLTFAALVSSAIVAIWFRGGRSRARLTLWLTIALAVASHSALDALVAYGEGIQFLAPWSVQRYASPWRPLGGGLVGDSLLFLVSYVVARYVLRRRGFALPRWLDPWFLRRAA
jgi:inner membrane protein